MKRESKRSRSRRHQKEGENERNNTQDQSHSWEEKEKNRVYRIPWIEVKSEDRHIDESACVEISDHGWTKGMISAR